MVDGLAPPIGLKTLRRLARRHGAREEAGCFVVEGQHPVTAALETGWPLVEVFVEPDADRAVVEAALAADVPVSQVAEGRLEPVVSTRSAQPVAAVARIRTVDPVGLEAAPGRFVLVLVDVGDPGNVGTLVRIGEAIGARAVLCLGETADPFNPKSVRASAGSVFAVDLVIEREAEPTVELLRQAGWCVTATSPVAEVDHDRADLTVPTALLLGSEARGLPPALDSAADRHVRIPMAGRTESLNVAMAGAVIGFEARRQLRAASS